MRIHRVASQSMRHVVDATSSRAGGARPRHVVHNGGAGGVDVYVRRRGRHVVSAAGHGDRPLRHVVMSHSTEPPGARLMGTTLGEPYTEREQWDAGDAGELEPEALRFAWDVQGHPARRAVVVEWVSCGCPSCHACQGDKYTHGPFVFEYRQRGSDPRDLERLPMRALGRRSPPPTIGEALDMLAAWRMLNEADRASQRWSNPACWASTADERRREKERDERQSERAAELAAALELFGLGPDFERPDVQRVHRRLAKVHHPDRGGDRETMARINAARDRLLEDLEHRR